MNHHALVIDDDPEIQAVVLDRLESLGHTCDTVGSQSEARDLIARGGHSYVLLDLEIPVSYGRPPRVPIGANMVQEIHATPDYEHVPIIVITGKGDMDVAIDVMKQGAVDFVTKPFKESGQTLEKAIQEALDKAARTARISAAGKPRKKPAHKDATPERFTGGELTIFTDRIELCRVEIVGAPDEAGLIRRIFEALAEKTPFGKYRAYSGPDLARKLGVERGQPAIADAVSGFRKKLQPLMLEEANLSIGQNDVLASGGRGYRLAERITVTFIGVPEPAVSVESIAIAPPGAESGLNHRQQWILAEVRKGRKLRRPDLIKQFRVSVATAKRDLSGLGDLIEFVGPARGGYYETRRTVPGDPKQTQRT